MKKIVDKKENRALSKMYLDKISKILHDRWEETQQAIKQKDNEQHRLK